MILQLNPPLWLDTPKGRGLAHFIIDSGIEHDLQWTVFITETRECWTFGNSNIRIAENFTLGRTPEGNYAEKLKTTTTVNLDGLKWGNGSSLPVEATNGGPQGKSVLEGSKLARSKADLPRSRSALDRLRRILRLGRG